VVNEREVQNRVVHTDREYQESELNQAANFINAHFGGKTLMEIRGELLDGMQVDTDRLNELMQTTLDVASKAFAEKESKEYIVTGESNLVDAVANTEVVRELFDAFAQKGAIVHLLDRCLDTHGIQLFIGEESGYQMLDDYSLITAPYEVNSEVAGVLGVIGPTRMEYQKVIPIVDVTARVLGTAMTVGRT
jgi:heat-inducible transcriptional repressor